LTSSALTGLSYDKLRGTGLANRCLNVEGKSGDAIKVSTGQRITDMCIEPFDVKVLEDGKYVNSNLTTKETGSLTGIEGPLTIENGNIVWKEKDGIDFAPTTTQISSGERFPFLFTVKNLVAQSEGDTFKEGSKISGEFKVPSYRTEDFIDPKGRGKGRGYD